MSVTTKVLDGIAADAIIIVLKNITFYYTLYETEAKLCYKTFLFIIHYVNT